MSFNVAIDARPGDCVLYKPSSVFGLLISVKSWHAISHVEIAIGNGESVASRDGKGVNRYPIRSDHVAAVLRPMVPINVAAGLAWFETVKGQGYDWLGLLRFSWRSEYVPSRFTDNKQFCSEFATRFYRQAGFDPFPREDADAVCPFQFLYVQQMVPIEGVPA